MDHCAPGREAYAALLVRSFLLRNGMMIGLLCKTRTSGSANNMNNGLRGLLAGAGAMKWGGGCLGTVLVFAIIYMLLGSC